MKKVKFEKLNIVIQEILNEVFQKPVTIIETIYGTPKRGEIPMYHFVLSGLLVDYIIMIQDPSKTYDYLKINELRNTDIFLKELYSAEDKHHHLFWSEHVSGAHKLDATKTYVLHDLLMQCGVIPGRKKEKAVPVMPTNTPSKPDHA